jgi:2-C-methyl-D-erythritol 4-phosphate cytidylyltransferase
MRAEACAQQYGLAIRIIAGGPTRQDTVQRLAEAAACELVLLQDVARPFVSERLLHAVISAGQMHGAAAAMLPCEVPVARLEGEWVVGHNDAGAAALFQAPQVFEQAKLLGVLQAARANDLSRQSTAQLWLDAGHRLYAVAGEKTNIKLTTPDDWLMAQSLVNLLH